jgi:hypothetical protein
MDELVFCCPNCTSVASTGISADQYTLQKNQLTKILIYCEPCQDYVSVLVRNTMLSSTLDRHGKFANVSDAIAFGAP